MMVSCSVQRRMMRRVNDVRGSIVNVMVGQGGRRRERMMRATCPSEMRDILEMEII
jgi:hypothetical protein